MYILEGIITGTLYIAFNGKWFLSSIYLCSSFIKFPSCSNLIKGIMNQIIIIWTQFFTVDGIYYFLFLVFHLS